MDKKNDSKDFKKNVEWILIFYLILNYYFYTHIKEHCNSVFLPYLFREGILPLSLHLSIIKNEEVTAVPGVTFFVMLPSDGPFSSSFIFIIFFI